MRKIEQWMLDTIKVQQQHFDKNSFASERLESVKDNTKVTTGRREDGAIVTSVYLYSNLIAQNSGKCWWFCMCGWNTPTTRSRISSLAHEANCHGVSVRKGIPYSGTKQVPETDWFTAERR